MVRVATGLVTICFCLLAFLTFQAFVKEWTLREVKAKVKTASEDVQKKEEEIVQAKLKIQEINTMLMPSNSKRDELLEKKNSLHNSEAEAVKNMETCEKEKNEVENKKKNAEEVLKKLKADQEKEKLTAEDQIKQLKQQILERDKKLCQFVDKKQEDGRKACEALEATN